MIFKYYCDGIYKFWGELCISPWQHAAQIISDYSLSPVLSIYSPRGEGEFLSFSLRTIATKEKSQEKVAAEVFCQARLGNPPFLPLNLFPVEVNAF